MGHLIIGSLVGVVRQTVGDHVIDERRRIPQSREDEVDVGTHDAGLGDAALCNGRIGLLKVVDHQVASIVREEQAGVKVTDHLATRVIAELVQLTHIVVVTEVGTGGVHIVGAVVECGADRHVDEGVATAGHIGGEAGVRSSQSRLSVIIGLVERLVGRNTLLGDVKVLLAGNCGEESGDGENRE